MAEEEEELKKVGAVMVKRSTFITRNLCPLPHTILVLVSGGTSTTLESEEGNVMGNGWF